MGALYRSEEMCLAQLFLQTEASYTCVAELGELGLVMFRDLNPDVSAFQRKFVNEVRRCDEMERKLRFLEREIKKDQIPMLDTGENPDAPQPREMIDLEATFEKLENELREVNANAEMLSKNAAELTELKHILRKTQTFFEEQHGEEAALDMLVSNSPDDTSHMFDDVSRLILRGSSMEETPGSRRARQSRGGGGPTAQQPIVPQQWASGGHQLKFVAGVIQRERLPAFERLLWRACRGNVFLRQSEITESLDDTVTGAKVNKTVFIIFFQGEQLKTKVKKICEGFRATLYPCPDTPQERREMSIGVMTRLEDLKTVLNQTNEHRYRVLVAASKNVRVWLTKVRKIKSIYHTLNLFNLDVTHKCLIAECWCPVTDLDRIQMALKRGTEESGSTVPSILNRMDTTQAPPTYHRTNKYTVGFQNIVDSYGIASYREINPAPYTIITFPFLFAVMFGDMGHGAIMLLAALFFIVREKRLEAARIQDEIFQTFFGGRYIIFLMGCFSIYTGLIYNDVFSKSTNFFGSSWQNTYHPDWLDKIYQNNPEASLMLQPNHDAYDRESGPYPIGVDPVWNLAEANKLNFLNSMKMKTSVILGIAQMTFGVVLSYQNYQYENSRIDILTMFIPQMLFLGCIFWYLCLEIIMKWLVFTANAGVVFGEKYPTSYCAPSLLIGLINMFMGFMKEARPRGFIDPSTGKMDPMCYLNYWYPGQAFFEGLFVFVAACCVPFMLFAKPYLLWKEQRDRQRAGMTQLSVVERVLLLVAVCSIPVMLLGKPACIYLEERRNRQRAATIAGSRMAVDRQSSGTIVEHYSDAESINSTSSAPEPSVRADVNGDDAEVVHNMDHSKIAGGDGHGHGDGPLDMGDIMVYQSIHTIEFALGCISHTASYLRLWALSLAHAQLSDVLWTMVFRRAFMVDGYLGAVVTYFLFFIFGSLTLGILVLMEGLSAFLHALRLHWVEFQSKFYRGLGYPFAPFSFEIILEEARAAEDANL